jgi:hypothetical protein
MLLGHCPSAQAVGSGARRTDYGVRKRCTPFGYRDPGKPPRSAIGRELPRRHLPDPMAVAEGVELARDARASVAEHHVRRYSAAYGHWG